jgi:TRAP-type C4-dicarboxylate transport system substrate-binding protein
MKKLLLIFLIVMIASTLVFSSCTEPSTSPSPSPTPSPSTSAEPAEPIIIKLGHDLPPNLPPALAPGWWAEEVTKATEGRVQVEVYPASSLATQEAALESLRSGVCDMYMISISSHRKNFPISEIVGIPGIGFPDETVEANTAHMNTFFELLEKYPAAAAEFDEFGPVFFYVIYSESYLLSKDKEIRVPTDLKGMKVGSNGIRLEFVERLGAAPVTDIPPLSYEKLQTGVTEATFAAISAAHDFQLHEVTDYAFDLPFGGGGMPIIINKDTWNKISPQDQQIMIDLASEASLISHEALAELNALSWQEMDDFGMRVTPTAEEVALWEDAMSQLWEDYIAGNEAAGISNAREIFEWWKDEADKAWGN